MKNLITLKSSESNISIAEKFVDIICTNYGISEELYGNILISVTEAVNNAIVHGNNNNPNKNVRIESDFVDNFLKISISDEGEGFDFTNIPDPTAQENIEKINGRGIFLIKNLSDGVEFLNNGSEILITFKLQ